MAGFDHPDRFPERHIGPGSGDLEKMLQVVGAPSLEKLMEETIPRSIRLPRGLDLPAPRGEAELLGELKALAGRNRVLRSCLGMGYHDCVVPAVIQRNVLENPGWYTQYTPYQAEIAQGRLEALLNFQTMVADLTGLPVAGASLLDEATAAAEAMSMCFGLHEKDTHQAFFVSELCHPQTIAVVKTRAEPLGIEVVVGDHRRIDPGKRLFGALVQYPDTYGTIQDYRELAQAVHAQGALLVIAADLLSLCLLTPPGEIGADIAIGSTQRFGVPMGYGGPHAAYLSTRGDFVRHLPGRLIGVSEDAQGRPALRMALQTREQHIRREKATSNICTAQVLLAVMSAFYAVYHGPRGLKAIAETVHRRTRALSSGLARLGFEVGTGPFFDTLTVKVESAPLALAAAESNGFNLRAIDGRTVGIALDETTTPRDLESLLGVFATLARKSAPHLEEPAEGTGWPAWAVRKSAYLTHPVFNTHHSETAMQRYIRSLEAKDLSLTHAMIALGSCTMKLNAAAEMAAVTWPEFGRLHPFAPRSQAAGYARIFADLEKWLCEITGFAAVSLQPNAGSQGEYAGLLVIRKHHQAKGEGTRDVCLIPSSAHGTNPASAVMAGYKVVVVECDERGNVDLADLKAKAATHASRLAALMMTYPSTHGVFEEDAKAICRVVHEHGGQVYMDGANMNAQVGLTRPAEIGADVCHLNLHKTFCIPHGGGGPGMGPIGVAKHLAELLPRHPLVEVGGKNGIGPVSAAPWGSASILLISWAYIAMMGAEGLTRATEVAILAANYLARRLSPHYPVLYEGAKGRVAHECILDLRAFKKSTGIEVDDVAKRLIDYGFHAPTVSFPVASTMMVEPTESEPLEELDRFCEAMISIREEIREIEQGVQPREGNVLKSSPHTAEVVTADRWDRPYPRSRAAFPTPAVKARKFWPSVGRVNNPLGDRRLVCTCPPVEAYRTGS